MKAFQLTEQTGKNHELLELIKQDQLVRVPVSLFAATMGYCEVQAVLVGKGIRPIQTESMRLGTKLHSALQQQEKKEKEIRSATEKELWTMVQSGIGVEIAWEGMVGFLRFQSIVLAGRMDKVQFLPEQKGFVITDVKTTRSETPRVYANEWLQGMAYATMMAKKMGLSLEKGMIEIEKRHAVTKKVLLTERVKISEALNEWFLQNVARFEALYHRKTEPLLHNNPRKCAACNPAFKNHCGVFWK